MKKTVTANISGFFFHIDEDAYEVLNNYLGTIRGYFSASEGREEIMADIEARIAEMFRQKITDSKQVVVLQDVTEVIAVMGQPKDFAEGAAEASSSSTYIEIKKRIYRDPDNEIMGGVCSGLGAYFGIDPVWVRVFFVVFLFITFGFTLLVYIILWIIIPKARTASEKLEMRGQPVTIENISKTVTEEFENLKTKFSGLATDAANIKKKDRIRRAIDDVFSFIGNLFALLVKAAVKVIGVVLILIAAGLAFVLFAMAFDDNFIMSIENDSVSVVTYDQLADIFFSSKKQSTLAYAGVFLFLLVPALALLAIGATMVLGIKKRVPYFGLGLGAVWLGAIIMCAIAGLGIASEFSEKGVVKNTGSLMPVAGDTLEVYVNPHEAMIDNPFHIKKDDVTLISIENDTIYFGYPKLDIRRSTTGNFEVEIVKSSRGKSKKFASERAMMVDHTWSQTDSALFISSYYSTEAENKFRNQQVKIILRVPSDKAVKLSRETASMLYDVDNVTNTWDGDMAGRTWQMKPEGLTCMNCN